MRNKYNLHLIFGLWWIFWWVCFDVFWLNGRNQRSEAGPLWEEEKIIQNWSHHFAPLSGINFGASRNQPGVHFRYEIKIIQGTVFVFSQTCSVFELTKPTPLQGGKNLSCLPVLLSAWLFDEGNNLIPGWKTRTEFIGAHNTPVLGVIKSDWIGSHSIARPRRKLGGLAHGWLNCACQITTERS